MEDFIDGYTWEIMLVLAIYVVSFYIFYKREIKLSNEVKNHLTNHLSLMEHKVLTKLLNKDWHIKWEVKNEQRIRYIIMEKSWDILFLRCKHNIWIDGISIFIKEEEVEMFSQDLKKYMNDNKCYARWLFITSCYTTSSRREQAEMNWIDLWDAFRWNRNLWRM